MPSVIYIDATRKQMLGLRDTATLSLMERVFL